MPVLTSPKFHLIKAIGTLIICYSVSCYMFDYPNQGDQTENGIELAVGIVLISLDFTKAVRELWQAVLTKFFAKK